MTKKARYLPEFLLKLSSLLQFGAGSDEDVVLSRRRWVFGSLVSLTIIVLITLMFSTLESEGFSFIKLLMIGSFTLTLPWIVIGFWHAVLGLWLMLFHHHPEQSVCPIQMGDETTILKPLGTALLSCVRNEEFTEVAKKLEAMLIDLRQEGCLYGYSLYVLSDSSEPDILLQEKELVNELKERWAGQAVITYRHRPDNTGFKAGNIQDFCRRWGHRHEFAVTLDADSFMSAATLRSLTHKMMANPRLGILQTLAVGLSSRSLFTRAFQWGMRLGMHSYSLGTAWWQGPCGPYWGHNAILRLKPFMEHCFLPEIGGNGPLSGPVLSHDQLEATLMSRGGYDVRVWTAEGGSYEENPTNLLGFIDRDLRWCHGNLQYLKLLGLPSLKPIGRLQLVLAILMFTCSPAWILFLALGAVSPYVTSQPIHYNPLFGTIVFISVMTMVFSPILSSLIFVASKKEQRKAFGGGVRFISSAFTQILFSSMLAPIMAVAHTVFITTLIFGGKCGWRGQVRSIVSLSWGKSIVKFWPQFLFGVLGSGWALSNGLWQFWPLIPIIAGPLLVVPFAVFTSSPMIGSWVTRWALWRIPEESDPPVEIEGLSSIGDMGMSLELPDEPQSRKAV
ncbi:glucans biosynthesis glucosyltransferase MdoH [Flexibacterium corallicola]|uniref:glucans biosynthesis glucosyltransferase MdoH n=1 Tax=Flexibacterium corallicola TaxID=3037259 RepID=UPI00286F62F9|nr:glucans biosynthesis glucosyltransferase MdoH [Pseudovibrio sp. M1P-2-3]